VPPEIVSTQLCDWRLRLNTADAKVAAAAQQFPNLARCVIVVNAERDYHPVLLARFRFLADRAYAALLFQHPLVFRRSNAWVLNILFGFTASQVQRLHRAAPR
jgi:hypothetical protein